MAWEEVENEEKANKSLLEVDRYLVTAGLYLILFVLRTFAHVY